MKSCLVAIIFFILAIIYTLPLQAESPESFKPTIRAERKEIRQEVQERVKELKAGLKDRLKTLKGQFAKIIGGEVASVLESSLQVSKDGKTYTVNIDESTKIRRHYWGKSSFPEFSVGNKVNVHGKYTDESKTTILARMIRNLSIMKRHGVFLGDVIAKNSDNFVINSKQRGDQTVFFTESTKFVKRNQESMSYSDLLMGHRVRVRGLWDKSLNKVTEVIQVKDYSLPPKPTKAVSPSITFTPTSTLTPTPAAI